MTEATPGGYRYWIWKAVYRYPPRVAAFTFIIASCIWYLVTGIAGGAVLFGLVMAVINCLYYRPGGSAYRRSSAKYEWWS